MNFQKQKKMKFQNDDVFTSSSSSSFSCTKINSETKKKKISKHRQRVLVMENSTKRKREMETKLLEKVSEVILAIKSAKQVDEKWKNFLVTHNQECKKKWNMAIYISYYIIQFSICKHTHTHTHTYIYIVRSNHYITLSVFIFCLYIK